MLLLLLWCFFAFQASEVEETLKRIRSHRGVEGILIVNNDGVALKSTLSAELTSQYASLFSQVGDGRVGRAISVARVACSKLNDLLCANSCCPVRSHLRVLFIL